MTLAVGKPAARVLGTGHALPAPLVRNEDLEARVGRSSAWIEERTGITARYHAPADVATSDLAVAACQRALDQAGLRADQIDLLVVATVRPDMPMPSTAAIVQARLGASRAIAFDVSAAMAGFVYALNIADNFFRAKSVRHALVVGADLMSRSLNFSDPNTAILFGDGAGAVLLGEADGSGRGVLGTRLYSDGHLVDVLRIPGGGTREPISMATLDARRNTIEMRGQELFKVAVKYLHSACKDVLDDQGMHVDQIDWLLPHQANLRILEFAMKRIGVPQHKLLTNIKQVGNTSAASIPILWDQARRDGRVRDGDLVLLCGLGAGVVWGGGLVRQ